MGWSPPSHLPHLYSDLFDLGNGAVGEVDSRLAIVEDWEAKFRRGIIYYLKDNHVRGVLLWNAFGLVDAARGNNCRRETLQATRLVSQATGLATGGRPRPRIFGPRPATQSQQAATSSWEET